MRFAVNLIVITAIGLSVQSCNGQCMYIICLATVLDIFLFVQHNPVQQVTVSGCTTNMAALLLKGVCCRSAFQTSGGQCVITALAVPLMEKLLVDNLDTVEVRSVSKNIISKCILYGVLFLF